MVTVRKLNNDIKKHKGIRKIPLTGLFLFWGFLSSCRIPHPGPRDMSFFLNLPFFSQSWDSNQVSPCWNYWPQSTHYLLNIICLIKSWPLVDHSYLQIIGDTCEWKLQHPFFPPFKPNSALIGCTYWSSYMEFYFWIEILSSQILK